MTLTKPLGLIWLLIFLSTCTFDNNITFYDGLIEEKTIF